MQTQGDSPAEAATARNDEWIGYFRQLVEKIMADDEITNKAMDSVVGACAAGNYGGDEPGLAIAKIVEANYKLKLGALKVLHEFITVHE